MVFILFRADTEHMVELQLISDSWATKHVYPSRTKGSSNHFHDCTMWNSHSNGFYSDKWIISVEQTYVPPRKLEIMLPRLSHVQGLSRNSCINTICTWYNFSPCAKMEYFPFLCPEQKMKQLFFSKFCLVRIILNILSVLRLVQGHFNAPCCAWGVSEQNF